MPVPVRLDSKDTDIEEKENNKKITSGAGSRIRTDDLLITNQLLYQLSYAGLPQMVFYSIFMGFSRVGPILTVYNVTYFKNSVGMLPAFCR